VSKKVIYTNIGGMPLTQDVLDFMQQSYIEGLSNMATLCGNYSILHGVEVNAGNVSDGAIVYNGEIIPFMAGAVGAGVAITDIESFAEYEDGSTHKITNAKIATCAPVGNFPFSNLVRLSSLQNIWQPGDLKQKYVPNSYVAANFDANGFGLNTEKGWRLLGSAVPGSAGRMLVNRDPATPALDEAGKTGGAATHTLTGDETGKLVIQAQADDGDGQTSSYLSVTKLRFNGTELSVGNNGANQYGPSVTVPLNNNAQPHNNMPPYLVVITLIKL
jgi:hypothetical protein